MAAESKKSTDKADQRNNLLLCKEDHDPSVGECGQKTLSGRNEHGNKHAKYKKHEPENFQDGTIELGASG